MPRQTLTQVKVVEHSEEEICNFAAKTKSGYYAIFLYEEIWRNATVHNINERILKLVQNVDLSLHITAL